MALARTISTVLTGLDVQLVTVEASISEGLPGMAWTGLPDTTVKESASRVKAAVESSGEQWPNRKVTVALLPAEVRKTGSGFDLAVAMSILAAQRSIDPTMVRDVVMIGGLGLDGRVLPVPGVMPAVIGAVRAGAAKVVVPRANAGEARLVPGAEVLGVGTVAELCAILRGEPVDVEPEDDPPVPVVVDLPLDLADVVGQPAARHAIEVAAAGGHHLLMTGPPGVGKTMLAERMPGILPDLTDSEALEVSAIHSLLGRLPAGQPLIRRPPFYAPHHSATVASLIGGGSGVPRPGLISLAHRGLLFLDEAVEFGTRTLEALRQPLESGAVTITRASGAATYPAHFQLVLAANPCACARGGRVTDAAKCRCTSQQLRQYQNKLSGPLLDRIDLRTRFEPISRAILDVDARGESTAAVRERVMAARERASWRLEGTPWTTNAQVPGPDLRNRWPPPPEAVSSLQLDLDRGKASNRGIDRILKVAWTLADLAGRDAPHRDDVETARDMRLTTPEDAAAEMRRSA